MHRKYGYNQGIVICFLSIATFMLCSNVKAVDKKTDGLQKQPVLLQELISGDTNMVKKLITEGTDVNVASSKAKVTPLMMASIMGYDGIVAELLAKGAKVNAEDYQKRQALHYAATAGKVDCAKLLIKAKAPICAQSVAGYSPLIMAVQSGWLDMVKLLITSGGCTDKPDNRGLTPLMWAGLKRRADVASYLISIGVNVDSVSKAGLTAVDYADIPNNAKTIAVLKQTESEANNDKVK